MIISNEFNKLPAVSFFENLDTKDEEIQSWNDAKIIPEVVLKFFSFSGRKRFSEKWLDSEIDDIWKHIFKIGESKDSGKVMYYKILNFLMQFLYLVSVSFLAKTINKHKFVICFLCYPKFISILKFLR